jgi:hypothetical protein
MQDAGCKMVRAPFADLHLVFYFAFYFLLSPGFDKEWIPYFCQNSQSATL